MIACQAISIEWPVQRTTVHTHCILQAATLMLWPLRSPLSPLSYA